MITAAAVAMTAALDVARLASAYTSGNIAATSAAFDPAIQVMHRSLQQALTPSLTKIAVRVGKPTKFRTAASFTADNPKAADWAKRHAAELVTDVTTQQRAMLRNLVHRAFVEHLTVDELSRLAQAVIGLTDDYADAVWTMRDALYNKAGRVVWAGSKRIEVPETITDDFVDREVDSYSERLLRARALNFARSETQRAALEGQRQVWEDRISEGYLEVDDERVWIKAGSGACPTCTAMNGKRAPIDGTWMLPDGTPVENPHAHPSCRCAQGIASRLKAAAFDKKAYMAAYHKSHYVPKNDGPSVPAVKPTSPTAGHPLDTAHMQQVGGQAGSNEGGKFKAADGSEWYIKKGKSPDHVSNEILAAALYKEAGVDVPDLQRAKYKGHEAVASRIENVTPQSAHGLQNLPGVAEGFAADAWLGNWDVVGLSYDNLSSKDGKAFRLDTGGALAYRAMGSPKGKAFGPTVTELKSLRNPAMNPTSAKVFEKLTTQQVGASIDRVTRISDDRIRQLVQQHWPSNKAMADLLIARKHDLLKQRRRLIAAAARWAAGSSLGIPFKGGTPEYHKAYNQLKAQKKKQAKLEAKGQGLAPHAPTVIAPPSGGSKPFDLHEDIAKYPPLGHPNHPATPAAKPSSKGPTTVTGEKEVAVQKADGSVYVAKPGDHVPAGEKILGPAGQTKSHSVVDSEGHYLDTINIPNTTSPAEVEKIKADHVAKKQAEKAQADALENVGVGVVLGHSRHSFAGDELLNNTQVKLTKDQRHAVQSYQNSSQAINSYLRGDGHPDQKDTSKHLSAAIRAQKPLEGEMIVWRGLPASVLKNHGEGAIFHDKAFISTTRAMGSAFGGGAKMKIRLPPGTKGISTNHHTDGFVNEREFILPHGARFKITKVVTHTKETLHKKKVYDPAQNKNVFKTTKTLHHSYTYEVDYLVPGSAANG